MKSEAIDRNGKKIEASISFSCHFRIGHQSVEDESLDLGDVESPHVEETGRTKEDNKIE